MSGLWTRNTYLTPAHFPGGHAAGIAIPRTLAEVPDIVRRATAVLPIGAQSSLTGGATPMGEVVLSTEKLTRVIDAGPSRIRVEAAVPVAVIRGRPGGARRLVPPGTDVHRGARRGIVATNAAGAATFRHGSVPSVGRRTDDGARGRIRSHRAAR